MIEIPHCAADFVKMCYPLVPGTGGAERQVSIQNDSGLPQGFADVSPAGPVLGPRHRMDEPRPIQ